MYRNARMCDASKRKMIYAQTNAMNLYLLSVDVVRTTVYLGRLRRMKTVLMRSSIFVMLC